MARGATGTATGLIGRLFNGGTATGLTEGQLLDRFISRNDEAAFEAIVARHGPMVLGVCRQWLHDPNDVDDAFQATFLVLVRKARTLSQRDLLGNWLYGVAYRIAVRSRAVAAKRKAQAIASDGVDVSDPRSSSDPLDGCELFEEVHRLPARYREPVVLCYLEGMTHEEAALRLGWPLGTVKGRLARAREQLHSRLVRRGIALGCASVAVSEALSRKVSAAVPTPLNHATIRAAMSLAGGKTLSAVVGLGLLSANAAALSEGVLHVMSLNAWKLTVGSLVVGVSCLTGGGVFAYQFGGLAPAAEGPKHHDHAQRELAPRVLNATDQTFDTLLNESLPWDQRRLDRIFHWSRAVADVETYQREASAPGKENTDKTPLEAHLKRMKRLLAKIESLDKPEEGLTDSARHVIETIEQQLSGKATSGAMSSGMMAGMMGPGPGMSMNRMAGMMGNAGRGGMMAGMMPGMASRGSNSAPIGSGLEAGSGGQSRGPEDEIADDGQRLYFKTAILREQVLRLDQSPKGRNLVKWLREPIPMSFVNGTPLQDVLKYIKAATASSKDDGLPIYIDPIGLQEAEKTTDSPVTLDLLGVPLRTTLRLLLEQLGLSYGVTEGMIYISTPDRVFTELKLAESLLENDDDAK